jgi:hypothetical protein
MNNYFQILLFVNIKIFRAVQLILKHNHSVKLYGEVALLFLKLLLNINSPRLPSL